MRLENLPIIIAIIFLTIYAFLMLPYLHTVVNEQLSMIEVAHNYPPQLELIHANIRRLVNTLFNVLYIAIILYATFHTLWIILSDKG